MSLNSQAVLVAVFGLRALLRDLLGAALRSDRRFRLCEATDLPAIIASVPDVTIVDAAQPVQALEAVSHIRRTTASKVMLISHVRGDYVLAKAGEAGVTGVAHMEDPLQTVIDGVWDTARGSVFYSPTVARLRGIDAVIAKLTKREMDVIACAARGSTDEETAKELRMAPATAESHRTRIMQKVGARDWAELMIFGLNVGIAALDDIRTGAPTRRSARRGAQ